MWRRSIAGAAALAILGLLVASPGMHLHAAGAERPTADRHHAADTGLPLLHSHVASHHYSHDNDTDPASGETSSTNDGDGVVALSIFQPRAPSIAAPALPALIEATPVVARPAATGYLVDLPHPRAHGPPACNRQPARAPPASASPAA